MLDMRVLQQVPEANVMTDLHNRFEINFFYREPYTLPEALFDIHPYTSIEVTLEVWEDAAKAQAIATKRAEGGRRMFWNYLLRDLRGSFSFDHGTFSDGNYWVSNTLPDKGFWLDTRYYSVILIQKRNVLITIKEETKHKRNLRKAEVIAILAEALVRKEPQPYSQLATLPGSNRPTHPYAALMAASTQWYILLFYLNYFGITYEEYVAAYGVPDFAPESWEQ